MSCGKSHGEGVAALDRRSFGFEREGRPHSDSPRRVRAGPHSNARAAYANARTAHADSHRDIHPNADADAHANRYADAETHAHADADAQTCAHSDAVAHAGDAHGDAEVYA